MTLYTFNWIVVMLSYLNKILLNLKRVVESQHHDTNKSNYHSMHFFLPFHWPRAHHVTWNNCLQMMVCSCVVTSKRVLVQIIFCSCVIGTTFSREKLGSLKEATTATPKTTSIKKWIYISPTNLGILLSHLLCLSLSKLSRNWIWNTSINLKLNF